VIALPGGGVDKVTRLVYGALDIYSNNPLFDSKIINVSCKIGIFNAPFVFY
jgi:hypothetical protein